MAERNILFTDFNSPDNQTPGNFETFYSDEQVQRALAIETREAEAKVREVTEEYKSRLQKLQDDAADLAALSDELHTDPAKYLGSIAERLKKENPAVYQEQADLLKSNQAEFIRQHEAQLKQKAESLKKDYLQTQRNGILAKKEAEGKVSQAKQQQQYQQDNPALYNKLYSLQKSAGGDDGASSLIIRSEKSGELGLAAKLRKQLGNGQNLGIDFVIRDGKITFPDRPVNSEQMALLLDFLQRHGIENFELPPQCDENLKDAYEKAHKEREKAAAQAARENDQRMPASPDPARPDAITQQEAPFAENIISSEADPGEDLVGKEPELKEQEKKSETEFEKACKGMETWLQKNQNKKQYASYWKHSHLMRKGGWTVYSVYPNENRNNYKNDGKRKNGEVSETYAYRIYLRPNKKGGIDVAYAMPKGGKVTDAVADKVIGMQKAAGCKYVRFPTGLSDEDTGVFRIACARAGVVPRGVGINEHHAQKMIDAAKGVLSEKDLEEFKFRLACQMEANMGSKSEDRTSKKIAELKGDYYFSPFKKKFEDIIKPDLQEKVNGKNAEEVIGSAKAIEDVYKYYSGAHNGNIGQMMSIMEEADRKAFTDKLMAEGIAVDPEIKVRDMPDSVMKALYTSLSEKRTAEVGPALIEELRQKREIDPDTKASDVTRNAVEDASNRLKELAGSMENDHAVPGMRIPYLGHPSYNYPKHLDDNTQQQTNGSNAQPPAGRTPLQQRPQRSM